MKIFIKIFATIGVFFTCLGLMALGIMLSNDTMCNILWNNGFYLQFYCIWVVSVLTFSVGLAGMIFSVALIWD